MRRRKTASMVMAGILGVTTVFLAGSPADIKQPVYAQSITVVASPAGECGEGVTYTFSNGLLTISGNGKISNDAFRNASDIISVVITDGITEIGDAVFSGCTQLSHITIADTVTTIRSCAFEDTKLTDLTLPESLTTLGAFVLKGNDGVKSLTIPKNVITMQANSGGYHGALYGSAVESVVFEKGIEKIPNQACHGATNLTKVTLPESVKTLGDSSFEGCTALTQIELPSRLNKIGTLSFANTALKELNIPESVTEMGAKILQENMNVKSLIIPKNMTVMQANSGGYHGSLYRSAIESVVFEEGIEKIPSQACHGATELTKATIPVSVEATGDDIVTGCKNIKIYCYRGSFIDEYALQNNIAYEYIGQAKDSVITVSNYTRTSSASKQNFKIKIKLEGLGVLSYSSDMASVVVDQKGNVTIAPDFVGKATITISVSSLGEYKAGSTRIVINVKPAKTQITKISNKKKNKMTIKWTKKAKVTGYQLQYSTNTKFNKGMKNLTISGSENDSKTISALKKKKTYYVRIRTYKLVAGKIYYSDWSTIKKIKITR